MSAPLPILRVQVHGGPKDGLRLTEPFPEGLWIAGPDGWPLVLDANAEPVGVDQTDGQRYVMSREPIPGQHPSRTMPSYWWEPWLKHGLERRGLA